MSKLIITTVGTSIIGNKLYPSPDFEPDIGLLSDGEPISNTLVGQIIDGTTNNILNNLNNKYNCSNKLLSAEIASLRAFKEGKGLGLSSDDVVALFSSDTEDGKLCAQVNYEVLKKLNWCQVNNPIVIDGLKTKPTTEDEDISQGFIDAGLKNFKNKVEALLKKNYTNKYLNITGGFKTTIPFSTIIAFNNHMSLIYLYEESNDLIVVNAPTTFSISYEEVKTFRIRKQLGG